MRSPSRAGWDIESLLVGDVTRLAQALCPRSPTASTGLGNLGLSRPVAHISFHSLS
jgi:hypothetical protein